MKTAEVTLKVIHKDLKLVMRELSEIKKQMVDVDSILSPKEEKELRASIANYRCGKTKNFDKLKKELDKRSKVYD